MDLVERTEEAQGLSEIRAGEVWSRKGWGEGWAAFLPLRVNKGDAVAVGSWQFSFLTFVPPFIPYTWDPSVEGACSCSSGQLSCDGPTGSRSRAGCVLFSL